MIKKIPTGIHFFDEAYGGTYQGRSMLVTARHGGGKTVAGLQFIGQGLRQQERCLLLSARPAEDVALTASAFDIPVVESIESGDFIILEYKEYVPGRDREDELKLPKDSFLQLKHIIEDQQIQRLVLDTVLPWVALDDEARLPEHIFSFVRVFQRIGVSTLFTMPKPASPPAKKLRRLIEDVVPVSLSLDHNPDTGERSLMVDKYLGATRVSKPMPFVIEPQVGIAAPGYGEQRATGNVKETKPNPAPKTGKFADAVLGDKAKVTASTPPQSESRINFKDAGKGP